jgi:hypothetical protein
MIDLEVIESRQLRQSPSIRSGLGSSPSWSYRTRPPALRPVSVFARQKVTIHLRALEANGLVRVSEKRRWGGLTERRMVATAASYVISPKALGAIAPDPGGREADRLSASYLSPSQPARFAEVGGMCATRAGAGQTPRDPVDRHAAALPIRGGACRASATSSELRSRLSPPSITIRW